MQSSSGRTHHSTSDKLAEAGAIVLAILLLVTWPWWLFVPPIAFLVALAVRPGFRSRIRLSFTQEAVDPDVARFRKLLTGWLFSLGAISGIVCAFDSGRVGLQWWLIPLPLLAAAFQLRALSIREGRWPRLQRALCSNLMELLSIAAVVLACYSLALWWLQSVSLDSWTLGRLRAWDEGIHSTHEFIEEHEFKLKALVLFLAVTLALRIATAIRPALAGFSTAATARMAETSKWLGRAISFVALAASLTFLATGEDSPAARIAMALRDAKGNYEHFQSAIEQKTDRLLCEAVIQKAWAARPQTLRDAMVQSASLQKERDRFEAMRTRARESYSIEPEPVSFPLSLETPEDDSTTSDAPASEPDDTWTPKSLNEAASSADAEGPSEKEKEEAGPAEEMARDALEELKPEEVLLKRSGLISALSAHYPAFGEFLDAILSSVSETWYNTTRRAILRRVTEKREPSREPDHEPNRERPIESAISAQVAVAVSTVTFDFSRFDASWSAATQAGIARYRGEIAAAANRLETQAEEKQRSMTESTGLAAEQDGRLLADAALAIFSQALSENATEVERIVLELETLGLNWPALTEPGGAQRVRMARISKEISDQGLDSRRAQDETAAAAHVKVVAHGMNLSSRSERKFDLSRLLAPPADTPLTALVDLRTFCSEKMTLAIGKSLDDPAESAALQRVAGPRYERYADEWRDEVQKAVEEQRKQQEDNEFRKQVEELKQDKEIEKRVEERSFERPDVP
jgi:hypothetical protein